jgi:hypothetical protein
VETSWTEDGWATRVELSGWPIGRDRNAVPVEFISRSSSSETPPAPAQLRALESLITDPGDFRRAVLAAIRAHYSRIRPKYVAFAHEHPSFMGDPALSMPPDPDDRQLSELLELQGIYVHDVVSNALAYVGLGFSASWEPEHGLGVMTHGDRVVEVGGSDTVFGLPRVDRRD